ncbi:MAG: PD-(D/E)XK nuclease family protein [Firmicutes bacterium]|nr:PD-(D/E)XK nuclease family protein [Bacillota bacterium]
MKSGETMIKLPKSGIILAPANMHLKIYDTYKDCVGVEVYALFTFIQRFLSKGKEDLEILYEYKNALKDISKANAFYSSCNDSDFLQACLSFLKDTKKYNVHSFPKHSQKEKDLKEILEVLDRIPLIEDTIPAIELPDCSNVYILQRNWSLSEYFWIEKLLKKGAHWIETETEQHQFYYSSSNTRKEMELVAQLILENDYDASDCMIALQSSAEKHACAQILEAHNIPFTFLANESLSKVNAYWVSLLEWIVNKNLNSFFNLIEQVYPNDTYVKDYFSSFPEEFENQVYHCQNIEYEKNNLISDNEWSRLLHIESLTKKWMEEHAGLFLWDHHSLTEVAKEVQNAIGSPSMEDLSAFSSIEKLCQQAYPYLNEREDLNLLIQSISTSKTSPNSRKGVCIGGKEDISGLYKVVFFVGVTSKQFPKFSQYTGIFNESYVQNVHNLPSLKDRLNTQKDLLFKTLSQPETFYCLYPQSDYAGKSLEQSLEMKQWIQQEPVFISPQEYSFYTKPEFSLSQESAKNLFVSHDTFTGSISRLEKMVKCPLSHFLSYGLYLNEVREWKDVSVRGTILHSILEELAGKYPKTYAKLSKEEITSVIQKEFKFAQIAFPKRKKWFDMQVLEISEKLSLIFEQLAQFEDHWNMSTAKQEYEMHKSLTHNGISVDFKGYIDRIDESETSFTIFDYKSSEKELKPNDFYTGVSLQLPTYAIAYNEDSNKQAMGHFYIPLKTTSQSYEAYKLGNKKVRTFDSIEEDQILTSFLEKPLNGWDYQDMSIYTDEDKRFKCPKEVPSFEQMKKDWEVIIHSILEQIFQGDIEPNFIDGACTYCKYNRICRNSKEEVLAHLRIEKGGNSDEV